MDKLHCEAAKLFIVKVARNIFKYLLEFVAVFIKSFYLKSLVRMFLDVQDDLIITSENETY